HRGDRVVRRRAPMKRLAGWLTVSAIAAAFLASSFWDARRGPGGVLALVGLALVLAAAWHALMQVGFLRRARTVAGQVIRLEPEQRGMRVAVFQFTDEAGGERTVWANTVANPPDYQVGDRVEVLFEPGQPERAIVRTFAALWAGALIIA